MKNAQNVTGTGMKLEIIEVADRSGLQALAKELGLTIGRLSTEAMKEALIAHITPTGSNDEPVTPNTTEDVIEEVKAETAKPNKTPKKEIKTVPLNTMVVGQVFKFPTSKSNYKCIEEDAEKGFKKIQNLNGKAWWLRHEKELNRPVVEIEEEILTDEIVSEEEILEEQE